MIRCFWTLLWFLRNVSICLNFVQAEKPGDEIAKNEVEDMFSNKQPVCNKQSRNFDLPSIFSNSTDSLEPFSPSITNASVNNSNVPKINCSLPIELENHMDNTVYANNSSEESKRKSFKSFNEWREAKLEEDIEEMKKSQTAIESEKLLDCLVDDTDTSKVESTNSFIDQQCFQDTLSIPEKVKAEDEDPKVKVYKHKFNFASLDCAATILETNSEAMGASAILVENKDTYLLHPCSVDNKFMVIELCQDILVEELVIANFEFFSSIFKDLKFYVSNNYQESEAEWKLLGSFQADNTREIQRFQIDKPLIWAKYLRIEILSHYGNEFYCPISLVRVHGKTMMDEIKQSKKEEVEAVKIIEKDIEEKELDNCAPSEYTPNNNLTDLTLLRNVTPVCMSKVKPLKFEIFLKNLNRSYCAPRQNKENTNLAQTSSSTLTEDSIFKNIMKRITSLETNTNLTVLYIEEQGKLLSDSFRQLEKTHATKLSNLMHAINSTIVQNLHSLSNFANQLNDHSILFLEEQKISNQKFTEESAMKIEKMEKELAFQRKMFLTMAIVFAALMSFVILNKEIYFDEGRNNEAWLSNPVVITSTRKNKSKCDVITTPKKNRKRVHRSPSYSSISVSSTNESPSEQQDSGDTVNQFEHVQLSTPQSIRSLSPKVNSFNVITDASNPSDHEWEL